MRNYQVIPPNPSAYFQSGQVIIKSGSSIDAGSVSLAIPEEAIV
ncbi:hypothetical protein [Microcoleus sp. Pol12A6]